jgi:hypothetical protein
MIPINASSPMVTGFVSSLPELEAKIRADHAKKVRAIEAAADFLRKAFPTAYEQGVELEAALKELFCGDVEEAIKNLVPFMPTFAPPSADLQIERLIQERDELTTQLDAVERAKKSMPDGFGDMLEGTMAPMVRARLRQVEDRLTSLTEGFTFDTSAPPEDVPKIVEP